MAVNKKYFDVAIGESVGNGGDIQLLGNDLAVIYGYENQVFLALFGGNVEENTPAVVSKNPTSDWWGNSLLYGTDKAKQFNSNTERTIYNTELSSAGRIKIENAVNDDLKFLEDLGATVNVTVTLPGINMVKIDVRVIYNDGTKRVTVITFGRRFADGDFSIFDFTEDFY